MQNKSIATINGKTIGVIQDKGVELIPIKPICDALGVDLESQRKKIKEDAILSSVSVLSTATGSDGKQREMFCLPLGYIFDWLVFISPSHLTNKDEDTIRAYHENCYNVLYYCYDKNRRLVGSKQKLTNKRFNNKFDQPLAKEIE